MQPPGMAPAAATPPATTATRAATSTGTATASVVTAPGGNNLHALEGRSNFRAIYGDATTRAQFMAFLSNVFHLFPEDRLHALIEDACQRGADDRAIYAQVQARLPDIRPLLANLRFALPALHRQKSEMVDQTLALLGPVRTIDGFLEIGSPGRYLGALRARLALRGDLVLMHTSAPSWSAEDIAERGTLLPLGRHVPLQDYAPLPSATVADRSLDLVANYIGFHHAPLPRLEGFVASLHRVLRPGGWLVVRDHDVDSPRMNRMVALAHDVFNMGLGSPWMANQQELRHFTANHDLVAYLHAHGFRGDGRRLFQEGDPTRNALMLFRRT